jgi:hypothetical protein
VNPPARDETALQVETPKQASAGARTRRVGGSSRRNGPFQNAGRRMSQELAALFQEIYDELTP